MNIYIYITRVGLLIILNVYFTVSSLYSAYYDGFCVVSAKLRSIVIRPCASDGGDGDLMMEMMMMSDAAADVRLNVQMPTAMTWQSIDPRACRQTLLIHLVSIIKKRANGHFIFCHNIVVP